MRQAIDEDFILDVLRNYVTYKTYWRLANGNPDDPEVDERKARAALVRFAELSPTSLEQPTNPNLLYDLPRAVWDHQLLVASELEAFAEDYARAQAKAVGAELAPKAHAELYRHTEPARDRFAELLDSDREAAEEFRAALRDYVRKYAFIAQIAGFAERDLERLYLFGKHLLQRLNLPTDASVDVGQVNLTHLGITRTGEGDFGLSRKGSRCCPGSVARRAAPRASPRKQHCPN